MNLNEYQSRCMKTAIYPNVGSNLSYPSLGLAGEAGEVCNKVKKVFRDGGGILSSEARDAISGELGGCLWYLSAIAHEIGLTLETIAERNLEQLASREVRGTLTGSGDNR